MTTGAPAAVGNTGGYRSGIAPQPAFATPASQPSTTPAPGGTGFTSAGAGGGAGGGVGVLFAAAFILFAWAGRRLLPKDVGVPSAPLVLLPDRPG